MQSKIICAVLFPCWVYLKSHVVHPSIESGTACPAIQRWIRCKNYYPDEDEVIIIIINHVQGPQLSTFSVAISNKYKIQKVKKII